MISSEAFPKRVLKLFLEICLNAIGKPDSIDLNFSSIRPKIKEFLINENINANLARLKQMINPDNKIDYTNGRDFYFMFIIEMFKLENKNISFRSYYSFLYFIKNINYLQILNDSDINIHENKKVKIFLFVSLLFLTNQMKENDLEDLNEAFFKGTFIELNREYSKILYEESNKVNELKTNWSNEVKRDIYYLIDDNFEIIKDLLNEIGKKNDDLIINMKKEVEDILDKINMVKDNNYTDILKEKIKSFYDKKEYLSLIYYYIDKISFKETIEINSIDSNILKNYNNFNLNEDPTLDEKTKRKIIDSRINLTSPKFFIECNLNDEIIICALKENLSLRSIQNIKDNIENIDQKEINIIIETILNDNELYQSFFSILKMNFVKKFFTENYILDENAIEYKYIIDKTKNSKCFKEIYYNFLFEYDKKDDNYNKFKNIIIVKILSKGTRACVIKQLKKILVNTSEFFIPDNINNNDLKIILKGYFLIILLCEIEHYFSLYDNKKFIVENNKRGKEGGRLFMKYVLGVDTIRSINLDQAKKLLDIKNWNNNDEIKTIFKGQKENDNITTKKNCFTNSISFDPINHDKKKKLMNNHIKK